MSRIRVTLIFHFRTVPWVLLDPVTGWTIEPESGSGFKSSIHHDPLEEQFETPGHRLERQPPQYFDQSGKPLYKYRKKYPHGYLG